MSLGTETTDIFWLINNKIKTLYLTYAKIVHVNGP